VAGGPVPFVGDAVALVTDVVAVIGQALARISGPLTLISQVLTRISGPVALISRGLSLVERGAALSQVGLGGLERLLGDLGSGLGLPDPKILQGQSGQPLALGVLDNLAGQLGQLA
jgi:hypothetical protein